MNLGAQNSVRSVLLRKGENKQRRQYKSDLVDTKPGRETLFTKGDMGQSLSGLPRSQHW